jgi:lysozyme
MNETVVLQGFDVSIYADAIEWSTVAASSVFRFAFLECARGMELGPYFPALWKSKPSDIACGSYQRLFSTTSGADQARIFIDAFSFAQLADGDLPPVIDVEPDPDGHRASPEDYLTAIGQWIDAIQKHFCRTPIIYTAPSFWNYLGSPAQFSSLPLWIADYAVSKPVIPQPWTTFAFWQYRQSAKVSGISKSVDLDLFSGDDSALNALVQRSLLKAP